MLYYASKLMVQAFTANEWGPQAISVNHFCSNHPMWLPLYNLSCFSVAAYKNQLFMQPVLKALFTVYMWTT